MLPSVEIGQLNNPYSCGTEGAVAVNGLSAAPAMTELPPPLSFPVTGPRKTRHTWQRLAAWEFVAADAPTTLASLVHFWGAALLIDLSTQWSAVPQRCASCGHSPYSLDFTPAGV